MVKQPVSSKHQNQRYSTVTLQWVLLLLGVMAIMALSVSYQSTIRELPHLLQTNEKASVVSSNGSITANNKRNVDADDTTTKQQVVLLQPPPPTESIPPNSPLFGKKRFFTHVHVDRSGAAILESLKAHAYAVATGLEYGGVCGESIMVPTYEAMISVLGLQHVIRFNKCPVNNETDLLTRSRNYRGVTGSRYDRGLPRGLSTSYLKYMRDIIAKQHQVQNLARTNSNTIQQVSVHIRRGDVKPCGLDRYLPNSLYLKLIQQYAPPGANVTIYSERSSYEPWNGTIRQYNLDFESNVTEVWQRMLASDVLILSRSAFSLVPAIVSSRAHTVVFVPFGEGWQEEPLPDWTVVSTQLMLEAKGEVQEMRKLKCPEQVSKD